MSKFDNKMETGSGGALSGNNAQESLWLKLAREGDVFANGITEGAVQSAARRWRSDPIGSTVETVGASACGAGMVTLSELPWPVAAFVAAASCQAVWNKFDPKSEHNLKRNSSLAAAWSTTWNDSSGIAARPCAEQIKLAAGDDAYDIGCTGISFMAGAGLRGMRMRGRTVAMYARETAYEFAENLNLKRVPQRIPTISERPPGALPGSMEQSIGTYVEHLNSRGLHAKLIYDQAGNPHLEPDIPITPVPEITRVPQALPMEHGYQFGSLQRFVQTSDGSIERIRGGMWTKMRSSDDAFTPAAHAAFDHGEDALSMFVNREGNIELLHDGYVLRTY